MLNAPTCGISAQEPPSAEGNSAMFCSPLWPRRLQTPEFATWIGGANSCGESFGGSIVIVTSPGSLPIAATMPIVCPGPTRKWQVHQDEPITNSLNYLFPMCLLPKHEISDFRPRDFVFERCWRARKRCTLELETGANGRRGERDFLNINTSLLRSGLAQTVRTLCGNRISVHARLARTTPRLTGAHPRAGIHSFRHSGAAVPLPDPSPPVFTRS